MLDQGQTICAAVTALMAYWLAYGIIAIRRPDLPTQGDIILVQYGFLLMFVFAWGVLPSVGIALGRW